MDRQDIDALLIGALYGELTPADETRLAAHLESHPSDRGALDDLKSARQAVRDSRIFALQLDPPQAVSALLLQEAHRRAPKRAAANEGAEQDSWFYRFTRSFLAHPAMAAAAMLVLVVGVAGTVWMKNGDSGFADKQVAAQRAAQEPTLALEAPAAATAPTPDPTAGADTNEAPADRGAAVEGAAGSAYQVSLDDKKLEANAQNFEAAANRDELALAKQEQGFARERQDAAKNKKTASIVVDTPRPQPKELPERATKGGAKASPKADVDRFDDGDGMIGGTGNAQIASGGGGAPSGRAVTAPGTAGPARNAPAQQPAAPPPPPPPAAAPAPSTVAPSKAPAKPTTTATTTPSIAKEAEKPAAPKAEPAPAKDNSLIAWAKAEHGRSVALANKGDCVGAAKAAVAVWNRVPDYYSQFMASDRLLKKCQAYVAAERDADAERSGKARSKRATSADEPASSR